MNKLDVLGDNREEVIICGSDGWTYIVDHDRNVVRYRFPDNVQVCICILRQQLSKINCFFDRKCKKHRLFNDITTGCFIVMQML